jgi:hypothetical protein
MHLEFRCKKSGYTLRGKRIEAIDPVLVIPRLIAFLRNNELDYTSGINVAGKNFEAFDNKFIKVLFPTLV